MNVSLLLCFRNQLGEPKKRHIFDKEMRFQVLRDHLLSHFGPSRAVQHVYLTRPISTENRNRTSTLVRLSRLIVLMMLLLLLNK